MGVRLAKNKSPAPLVKTNFSVYPYTQRAHVREGLGAMPDYGTVTMKQVGVAIVTCPNCEAPAALLDVPSPRNPHKTILACQVCKHSWYGARPGTVRKQMSEEEQALKLKQADEAYAKAREPAAPDPDPLAGLWKEE